MNDVASERDAEKVSTMEDLREFLNLLSRTWENDAEASHGAEDAIYARVLQLCAAGHPASTAMAEAVLVTRDWDVTRWYA